MTLTTSAVSIGAPHNASNQNLELFEVRKQQKELWENGIDLWVEIIWNLN